jgi:predicted TIM-barrel fold metal-dependent hydrolase
MQQYQKFRTDSRPPVPALPPGSWDCQFHVFGDPGRYPPRSGTAYVPFPEATIDAALDMHRVLGFAHGVIVQSTVYGKDHSALLDGLAKAGSGYLGIAIVDDDVSDRELERLHQGGVRGARFNFWKKLNMAPTPDSFRRSVRRIRDLGWIAKIHAAGDEWLDLFPLLREADVPLVIDHFGHLDIGRGLDQPVAKLFLEHLRGENWWIMISGGDRVSAMTESWDDAARFIGTIASTAPDRTIWSTDWPHVQYVKPMPTDTQLLELLYKATPDLDIRNKVLCANPAALFGVQPAPL